MHKPSGWHEIERSPMSQPNSPRYVTCPCQHCSGKIEFDADQIDVTGAAGNTLTGQTIPCPHCGLDTIFIPNARQKMPSSSPPKIPLDATIKPPSLERVSPIKNPPLAIWRWCMRHKIWASVILFWLFVSAVGATIEDSTQFSLIGLTWRFAGIFLVAIFWVFIAIIYFAPYFIAKDRNKSNAIAILVLNIFLGWTLIGWVVALVWAHMKDDK